MTSTGLDPEALVDGVTLTLRTHLPTAIAELNAEPGAVQLVAVDTDRWFPGGHGAPIPDLGVRPAGEVSAASGRALDMDIAPRTATHTTPIMVALWFGEPDYGTLSRMCWRYVRALSLALSRRGVAGGHTIPESIEWDVGLGLDPEADGGANPQAWRGCAFVVVTVSDRVPVA
jgi:hypothetical protein